MPKRGSDRIPSVSVDGSGIDSVGDLGEFLDGSTSGDEPGITRRGFLQGVTTTGTFALGALLGLRRTALPHMDGTFSRGVIRFLDGMATPSLVDWIYNWEAAAPHLEALGAGFVLRHHEALQRLNAEEAAVSAGGMTAGVTRTGRISVISGPYTALGHLSPHFPYDDDLPRKGAKPWEGMLFGIHQTDRGTAWVDDLVNGETAIDGYDAPDGTTLLLSYGNDRFEITETIDGDVTDNAIVRNVTIENAADTTQSGTFVTHAQLNANDDRQFFGLWKSHGNRLVDLGTGVQWRDLEPTAFEDDPVRVTMSMNPDPEHVGIVDVGPFSTDIAAGEAYPVINHFRSTEDGGRVTLDDRGVLDTVVERTLGDRGRSRTVGRYLAGALGRGFELEPGESRTFEVRVRAGAGGPPVPAVSPDTAIDSSGIPERYVPDFERAARTVSMLSDPATGGISASPNLHPAYWPVWPRDASINAVAMARTGLLDPAERFFAEYLPSVQEDDGSFKQCYDAIGRFAGMWVTENDQPAIVTWGIGETYREMRRRDERRAAEFLRETAPVVERALDYTRGQITGYDPAWIDRTPVAATTERFDDAFENGLLRPSYDIAEQFSDMRQSLWTNVWAAAGLRSGARIAEELAGLSGADRYRDAARYVEDAIEREFFGGGRYYTAIGAHGKYYNGRTYNAAALWTGWANRYGYADALADDLLDVYRKDDGYWIPGALLLATGLAHGGRRREAVAIIDDAVRHTTHGGYLAEAVDGGDRQFASPLGWASAQLVHALAELYR